MQSHYSVNGQRIVSSDRNLQDIIAALPAPRRLHCLCKEPPTEMYASFRHKAYRLCCMPGTAAMHHPQCEHYEPPLSISGAGQVMGTAIEEKDDDVVSLKLDFALTKLPGRAPPVASGLPSEVAKDAPRKLTMRGLLHYLWQEAGFHKWSPRMEGKRNGWVFAKYIHLAASNKKVKAGNLGDLLVVPRPLSQWGEDKASAKPMTLARASTDSTGVKRLGLILGEVEKFESKALSHGVRLANLPEQLLEISDDLYKQVDKVFAGVLSMWEPDNNKLIMLASYYLNTVGVPVVSELVFMNVTLDYLPFENLFEKSLLDRLVATQRRFSKSLRFNLSPKAVISSAVLTDTHAPTAIFLLPPGGDVAVFDSQVNEAQESGLSVWTWRIGVEVEPTLPGIAQLI